ncbi:hypothetical protein DITRI_Ditri08aG0049600 [Diplodiscus trichospermus]
MIVLAWNCQGVGSTLTVQALKKLKKSFDPDLMFLMETTNKCGKLEKIREVLKMDEGVYSEPERLSGGLVLWWKKEVGMNIVIGNKNVIETLVWDQEKKISTKVFWIYGAPVFEERGKV